jgi:hypothetical protein
MFWMRAVPKEPNSVERLRRNFDVIELPDALLFLSSAMNILANGLGYKTSVETRACVLGDGRLIPMMSYSLVEYFLGLDLKHFDLLELGGGGSTEFWASQARSVLTLETNDEWAQSLKLKQLPNLETRKGTPEKLGSEMLALGRTFDAIVIDCAASRLECAKAALKILNPGGFIILDNSDWYPNTARLLRDGDLIEIDFHDFRPLHHFRCTTSLFMHRDFRPKPKTGRLPLLPIGGKDMSSTNQWDRPVPG